MCSGSAALLPPPSLSSESITLPNLSEKCRPWNDSVGAGLRVLDLAVLPDPSVPSLVSQSLCLYGMRMSENHVVIGLNVHTMPTGSGKEVHNSSQTVLLRLRET